MITFYYFWKINKYDNKYENFSKFKKIPEPLFPTGDEFVDSE
jgi:hypothetical protein